MEKYKLKDYIEKLQEHNLLIEYNANSDVLNTLIDKVSYNSKEVSKNTLFVCKGLKYKPEYLDSAIKLGAIAYIAEENNVTRKDFPYIIVNNIQQALALVSCIFYNFPAEKINMIGITGTKGKSTTAYYIKSILDNYMIDLHEKDTAIISSIDTYDGIIKKESLLTSPESLELQYHIRNAVNSDIKNLVMEVSSQALKLSRVGNIIYDICAFLNISEDHISSIEHPNFEDYFNSKLKIFDQAKTAVVNLDCDYSDIILKTAHKCNKVITFGTSPSANVYGYNIKKEGHNNIKFRVKTPYFDEDMLLTMPGLFNVENALAAIAIAVSMNIPYKNIFDGLKVARASGRMESHSSKDGSIIVIVDYAHNKLSFEKLYKSTKQEYPDKKIVTVFGCPGGKAQIRRRDLGTLAGINSDISYLTAEDPGPEDTVSICEEISNYIKKEHGKYKIVEDRGEAIKKAILENPNSVVLITGKGNETRQKYGTKYVKCLTDTQYAEKYLKEYEKTLKIE